jgi:glycosyltransferase involved in cell wall biosynthesis
VPSSRGPDVVLLYAPPWSGATRFSKHHLAAHFAARGQRVLYVEAPLTPLGVARGRRFVPELLRSLLPPRHVEKNLWVARPFCPVPYHAVSRLTASRAANRIGQRLLAPLLRGYLRRLGLRRPIVIAGLPHAADVVERLPRRCLVYHCSDDFSQVHGFPSSLPDLEAELCRRADLVVTTSQTLCEERRAYNANTHWIANGVDVERFAQSVPPAAELRRLKKPIVGFVGGLSAWVDTHLLTTLARRRPAWTLCLVGPAGGADLRPLRNLGNVLLLGPRPYADLPRYLAGMDVALIPFVRDRLTWHADPIKAYEYLAAGLPVVASDLPALRRLSDVVRLASSADEFLSQIEQALTDDRRTERQAEAARHSWASRFAAFDALLEPLLE